jgi:hypothetical protein
MIQLLCIEEGNSKSDNVKRQIISSRYQTLKSFGLRRTQGLLILGVILTRRGKLEMEHEEGKNEGSLFASRHSPKKLEFSAVDAWGIF